MALKPTIYKFGITLANIDENLYDTLNLTIARHPSESNERMMARVLAFCMNAQEGLSFTKGLSAVEEPDIWARTLDGRLSLWIDMGEPTADRIKKATRLCPEVKVYSFNFKSQGWWTKNQDAFNGLKASVFRFQWTGIQVLAEMVTRTMDLSVTISDNIVYISGKNGDCEVSWTQLQGAE